MKPKTIFIIILSVLLTIILMKNTHEIRFWFFGDVNVMLLAILGIFFAVGLFFGYLMGRPSKKEIPMEVFSEESESFNDHDRREPEQGNKKYLSDEDRDYIN